MEMISRLGDGFVFIHIFPALLSYYLYLTNNGIYFSQKGYLITVLIEDTSLSHYSVYLIFLFFKTDLKVLK